MSDTPQTSAEPAAPAPPVGAGVPQRPRALLWLGGLAVVLAVVSLVGMLLLWQRLAFTQQELARRAQDALTQSVEARTLSGQSTAEVQALQGRLAVLESRIAEVTLQRSQLENLLNSVSRSRDDNLVQDLDASLRMAHQQAEFTGSVQPLISALQGAAQRIERAAQPRLHPVQRALERDIDRLRATPVADLPALLQRLDELTQRVDRWPLANDPPTRQRKGSPLAAPTPAPVPAPEGWQQRLWHGAQGLWQAAFERMGHLLRVSRIDRPEAALLAPEQGYFLRENLKLLLLNSRLALMSRQTTHARADLQRLDNLVERFFDNNATEVIAGRQALQGLQADLVDLPVPRPDDSLSALAAAATH